ncbi:MAG: recombinase family protein [Verrucomicrobiota bacterium]
MAQAQLAISYVRFSTMGQSEGDSVRRQTEATEAYCKKHGLILTDKYRLRDLGKSAYKGDHRSPTGALGQLEKQVAEGKIPAGTVLIVENLDRLSRENIIAAQLMLLNLINKGIEIVALTDNERRYSAESLKNNPFELIVSIIVLSRAHEESKTKSYRAKQSWAQRKHLITQGKHIKLRLPCWLQSCDGKYLPVPDKVQLIKYIHKLYLDGYGAQSICTKLTEAGQPNIATPQKGAALRWHSTTILRLLNSKALIGYYTHVTPEIPNFFPAVISESDFYAVQARIQQRVSYRGQRTYNPHPFTHLIKCERCGNNMVKKQMNGYNYLQCSASKEKVCSSRTIRYYPIERALLEIIAATDATTFAIDDNAALQVQKKIDALKGRITEIEGKLSAAEILFKETPSSTGSKILQELELNRDNLVQQLESDRNSTYLVDYRDSWKEVKARLEADMKKSSLLPLEVIPVSIKMVAGNMEFIRHEDTRDAADLIALREALRTQIEKVVMNIPDSHATIHCKSGKTIPVELKVSRSYPRQLFYRTDNTNWIGVDTSVAK